jgi:hypothetical protein
LTVGGFTDDPDVWFLCEEIRNPLSDDNVAVGKHYANLTSGIGIFGFLLAFPKQLF